MKEKKLIDLYKKQLAQSSEKAPEGLWDDIARELDENQLISRYKEELAGSAEKAPAGLWDDIAKEMDENQLISQYKEEVAQSAEKAPVGLWDDISRKMDLDEVWEGVATGLDEDNKKRKGVFWWFNRGVAAAIAILLVSTLSVWFFNNLSSPEADLAVTEGMETERTMPANEGQAEESAEVTLPVKQPEFTITIAGRSTRDEAIQETENTAIAALQEQDDAYEDENILQSLLQENITAQGITAFDPLVASTASLSTMGQPSLQGMSSYDSTEEESKYNLNLPQTDTDNSVLALGFTTAMKNTWLFNHETFRGFDPGSGSKTNVQIYPDVAVSLRYLLSDRWKIESSFSFSSGAGQSYEQFIYGRYSQREIALNYFHAEVLTGFNHSKRWVVRSHAISHTTSVGLYYGMLNAANESIAGKKEDISSLYRKDDYGIVTGHNLNIPVFGNLIFSPGMYITWGLPNIYQGEYTLPSLKKTHNRSVELRLSLYYNFSR